MSNNDPIQALRYLKKAMEDPANLDADITFAFNFCASREEGLAWLERTEKRGEHRTRFLLERTNQINM